MGRLVSLDAEGRLTHHLLYLVLPKGKEEVLQRSG